MSRIISTLTSCLRLSRPRTRADIPNAFRPSECPTAPNLSKRQRFQKLKDRVTGSNVYVDGFDKAAAEKRLKKSQARREKEELLLEKKKLSTEEVYVWKDYHAPGYVCPYESPAEEEGNEIEFPSVEYQLWLINRPISSRSRKNGRSGATSKPTLKVATCQTKNNIRLSKIVPLDDYMPENLPKKTQPEFVPYQFEYNDDAWCKDRGDTAYSIRRNLLDVSLASECTFVPETQLKDESRLDEPKKQDSDCYFEVDWSLVAEQQKNERILVDEPMYESINLIQFSLLQ